MKRFKYLIVGGGMAADAAVAGIREIDPAATIGLFSAESDPPYARPPLTKGLWKGESLDSIWRRTEEKGVEVHLGRAIGAIDPARQEALDGRGNRYGYERLLLATGGAPRRLPGAQADILYFRNLGDYRLLRAASDRNGSTVVIGGGFIGSEIAAALALNRRRVTLIFPGIGLGDRIYPARLSRFLADYFRSKGVEVLASETVADVTARDGSAVVRTGSGREFVADVVVAGLGIEPEATLARKAGLAVDDGIIVDHVLRTSAPGIYAAGDVANFFCRPLDRRMRVEHEDNALTMGRLAGRTMAGAEERYLHLPFFYSDLFDLGYEAVGLTDSRLDLVEDWQEMGRKGVVYYLDHGQVRGVLLWNTWGQVDAARALIESRASHTAASLKGRIKD